MNKALSLFLVLVFLLVNSGCSVSNKDGDDMRRSMGQQSTSSLSSQGQSDLIGVERNSINKSSYYDYLCQREEYNLLSDANEKDLYKRISDSVYIISNKVDPNGYYPIKSIDLNNVELSQDKIKKVVSAFRNDNPDVFWLVNMFGYVYNNSNTKIQLYSFLSPNDCNGNIDKVNAVFSDVIKQMPGELSEYGREKFLHDWLLNNCTYDQQALNNRDNNWASFSILGVALNKSAVCEGYSRTLQLLLSYANIQCRLVSGSSRQNPHMWNLVNIDGNWYHMDATFNDSSDFGVYNYFNLTDELIKTDHTIDPDYSNTRSNSSLYVNGTNDFSQYNLDLPNCTETARNYFVMEAIPVKSLDSNLDDKAITTVYNRAVNKEKNISFIIDPSLNYEDTIEKLIKKPPYKVFYYVDEANSMLDSGYKIDSQRLSYVETENQRAVTVKLSYN